VGQGRRRGPGQTAGRRPLLAKAQQRYRFTGDLKTPTDRMAEIADKLTKDAQSIQGLLARDAQDPLAKGLRGDHLTQDELKTISRWLQPPSPGRGKRSGDAGPVERLGAVTGLTPKGESSGAVVRRGSERSGCSDPKK